MPYYSEQLFLLTIDPVSGRLYPLGDQVLHLNLAGALIFDASFRGLINDDWQHLDIINGEETGHPALDEAMRCLQLARPPIPLDRAVALVGAHGRTLRAQVRDSLLQQGMISRKSANLLSGPRIAEFYTPHLPLVVRLHQTIRECILHDAIPDFDVPPLISLMVAAGLTTYILKPHEQERFRDKITWLAQLETMGQEVIRAVAALEQADLDQDAAALLGMGHEGPRTSAGGMDAVMSSLGFLFRETGAGRSRKLIAHFNQRGGFECPGCAWPNPDHHRSRFEFCENGAKNVSAEATTRHVDADFFARWPVAELLLTPHHWLEQQGRLTTPMLLEEGASHYRPVDWDEAFEIVAAELQALDDPDEAVFYASGRTSNEAAFLYQLFARAFGTNNLPNSANLCHEPSAVALNRSLGFGKSSVRLEDFDHADAIFLFGHNPGSNHPRMLSALQSAVRRGCRIVAVNPMPEASLFGFANPQEASAWFGRQTSLAHLFLQPMINGDQALVRGMVKAIFELEEARGGILDQEFIASHTSGLAAYRDLVAAASWDELVAASSISREEMAAAAEIYATSANVIVCWCLGITHHRNSVATIGELINFQLLRGNIGRPGAGLCPVRGHSNIQGMRTAGAGETMAEAQIAALEEHFGLHLSRRPGLAAVPAFHAMAAGRIKVLIALGGNLAAALPETELAESALRRCRLTVMISTKLNRSHLVTGRRALILPTLGRTDLDRSHGNTQYVTIEDAMGKIGFSSGCLEPPSADLRSECAIIAGMAAAVLHKRCHIDWQRLGADYHHVRAAISRTVPALSQLHQARPGADGPYLDNPLRRRNFRTADGRAHFSASPLEQARPGPGELMLMTIRSHDQFNTSIFGLDDRYRGIHAERRVVFMSPQDMEERGISAGQTVTISSHYKERIHHLEGYYAIPYPIHRGCAAAYFPEANALTFMESAAPDCHTPAYKSVAVTIK